MADYFVSKDRGNDTTGAGTAANPWRTINKAIGSSPAISLTSPAVLYVEPGLYNEAVTLGLSPTSTNTLRIVGDADGSGFAAGGYATPKTGVVDWAAWSSDTSPLASPCLYALSKSYTTVERIRFTAGEPTIPTYGGGLSIKYGTDWAVRDCVFLGSQTETNRPTGIAYEGATGGGAANILIERCDSYSPPRPYGGCGIGVYLYEQASEYSTNITIRNCRVIMSQSQGGTFGIGVTNVGGSGGKLGTGITIEFCTIWGGLYGVQVYRADTTKPLATPVVVRGCLIQSAPNGIAAGSTTQVAEDYNVWNAATPRTNVTAGANSLSGVRPAIGLDDGRAFGTPRRPLFAPDDLAIYKVPSTAGFTFPAVDRYGRTRNADTAVGAVEIGYDAATVDPSAAIINGGLIR